VAPTVGEAWFDAAELEGRAKAKHGSAGATCPECGVWRWMPLSYAHLPPLRPEPAWEGKDVIASPEWFGDGWKAFRQILVRRVLAQLIAQASPKDFKVREVL
jgi:hypothetical protein